MYIHLKTLGCRLNEAELETWAQAFQNAGHQIVNQAEQAHLIIINSCAVTSDAARKSRHLIRKIHRQNPQAKLVVTGCYATLNEQEASSLLGVDLVVGNTQKAQLPEYVLNQLNFASMPAMATEPGETALFNRGRQRAFIKVQDGCRYRCTFCIVTVARGEESSRPLSEIIKEINTLQEQGVQEIVLTGVHLGGYGSDIELNLSDLIRTVLNETDIARIRLGSLEPWELNSDFFELFENNRLMPHLHLPLQSGSDAILRKMARRCKTEEFRQIINQARTIHPHFNITTDIIVGFPGETEQDWQTGLEFIEQTGFGHMHIFSYSKREGTKAALMPEQIDETVKKQRSRELHQLAEQMKLAFMQRNLGQTAEILWEAQTQSVDEKNQLIFGYTPNYLRVACQIDVHETKANQIEPVRLATVNDPYILSQPVDSKSVGIDGS